MQGGGRSPGPAGRESWSAQPRPSTVSVFAAHWNDERGGSRRNPPRIGKRLQTHLFGQDLAGSISSSAASIAHPQSRQPSRNEPTMYIGSGILVTVLIVLAIIFFAKRV